VPETRLPARFGSYILLDRIASGGMADVYRAKASGAEDFQRLVAIKCMRPDLGDDKQFVPMFIDEAKLAAQLSHSNIVQIYELGRVGSRLYIAMELIWGKDLKQILRTLRALGKQLPLQLCAYVVHRTAEALDYAHQFTTVEGRRLNLIHRDVSPQNLLITYDGQLKVVDFGIARADERQTQTQVGVLKGKFAYMAPEQTANQPLDHRVDIFALGSVFFEMLTGRQLFGAENQLAIIEKVRTMAPPPIQSLRPDVPAEVDQILARALAKRPDQRYRTALELAEAVSRFLIHDNTIFGERQAGSFMGTVYAEDIERAGAVMKRYLAIRPEDCADVPRADTQVFERSATGPVSHTGLSMRPVERTLIVEDSGPRERTQLTADAAQGLRGGTAVSDGPGPVMSPLMAEATVRDIPAMLDVERTDAEMPAVETTAITDVESIAPERTIIAQMEARAPAATPWRPDRRQLFLGISIVLLVLAVLALSAALTAQPAPGPATAMNTVRHVPHAADEEWGYLSIRVDGVASARVYVDGREVGLAPVSSLRVPAGRRHIVVVELVDGVPRRKKGTEVRVGAEHERDSPQRVSIDL
jgi:hypothetical protein